MRSSGLTLIELLVVITIISLLLALSLGVVGLVRAQAKETVCQANLRQLCLAFLAYEATYQHLPYGYAALLGPPPPGGYLGNPALDVPGWYWPDFVRLVQDGTPRARRILECPARRVDNPLLQNYVLYGNYGANRSLCRSAYDRARYRDTFGGIPLSSSDVPSPGQTLLLVDSGHALISWWSVRDEAPTDDVSFVADTAYIPGLSINKDRELWPGQDDDAIGGRHPNKRVNIAFLDTHVERRDAEKMLLRKDDAGQHPQRSPLWDP